MRWFYVVCLGLFGFEPGTAQSSQAGGRIAYQCCESDAQIEVKGHSPTFGRTAPR